MDDSKNIFTCNNCGDQFCSVCSNSPEPEQFCSWNCWQQFNNKSEIPNYSEEYLEVIKEKTNLNTPTFTNVFKE